MSLYEYEFMGLVQDGQGDMLCVHRSLANGSYTWAGGEPKWSGGGLFEDLAYAAKRWADDHPGTEEATVRLLERCCG